MKQNVHAKIISERLGHESKRQP
ncbi:hypothetical protein M3223_18145 [Paenibacillus pasadenensis]|nr:hypothetical protein [Paenibacillus pasadenensis]